LIAFRTLCILAGLLYALGGVASNVVLPTVEVFDGVQWSKFNISLKSGTYGFAAAVLRAFLAHVQY
jgi:hypothetical protein